MGADQGIYVNHKSGPGLNSKFYVSQRSRDDGTWSAWQSLDGGAGSSPTTIAGVNDTKQFAYVLAGNNKHVYTDGGTYGIAV